MIDVPFGSYTLLDCNLLRNLKIVKGSIASWILQHRKDEIIEIGSLGRIASALGICKSAVKQSLDWLVDQKYLEPQNPLLPWQAAEILRQKPIIYFWKNNVVCEWCGSSCLRLHEHHYPIPKAEGGTTIVSICPNCHDEFHYLTGNMRYRVTSKLLNLRATQDDQVTYQ